MHTEGSVFHGWVRSGVWAVGRKSESLEAVVSTWVLHVVRVSGRLPQAVSSALSEPEW